MNMYTVKSNPKLKEPFLKAAIVVSRSMAEAYQEMYEWWSDELPKDQLVIEHIGEANPGAEPGILSIQSHFDHVHHIDLIHRLHYEMEE